jgi:hypothetical protein
MSPEDGLSINYDDTDEESITDEENITDDGCEDVTHPKVDKVAFRAAYNAIPNASKLQLSTGKIVEDVLFEFVKDLDFEQ